MNKISQKLNRKYLKESVHEAALKRIEYIFNEFDLIQIAFSAGKDSGVMLNIVLDYIIENKPKNKIILYTLDYECSYTQTIDYTEEMFKKCEPYMEIYNVCLPIKAQCSVNSNDSYWEPWKFTDQDIWVRELPEGSVNELQNDLDFGYNIADYEFNTEFSQYLYRKYKPEKMCTLVGIRADESLNRQRIFYNKKNKYKNTIWSTKLDPESKDIIYNMYPLYDWSTEDIWTYNSKFNKPYNDLYNLMYYASVPVSSMRVASPFNDSAISSLNLFKIINPGTWGKLIGRVNGVNTAALYGNTSVYGWKDIKLPDNHTWETYTNFLLGTLDEDARESYLKKFNTSIKFWKEKGAALSKEIIKELDRVNMKYENLGCSSKQSKNDVIRFEYYPDELDIKDWKSIGSWKRFAVAILKNDHTCKTLGFAPNKSEKEKRKEAENTIKGIL